MNSKTFTETIVPKVLVVDDRRENVIAMKKILQSMKLEIHEANSGEEALSSALEHDFAVILLDVQMPEMDGFEVASLMQSNEATSHMPIIFVTALNKEKKYIEKGHEAGAVDYLFKPVDPDILKSKVSVFCKLYCREKTLETLLVENETIKKDLQESNQKLQHLANYDLLTKLPNRSQFEKSIEGTLDSSKRHKHIFALLFIDIDNFKSINDTHGHHIGDLLLQSVAETLQFCFRKSDDTSCLTSNGIVSRLGGDEFAVILHELKNTDDAGIVAKRSIDKVSQTYHLEGIDVHVSLSIGIACFPEAGEDVATLYKNADTAMYEAKMQGKNNYKYYTAELNKKHTKRLSVENALSLAIERKELELYYQPIYRLKDKKLLGVEALLRWNSPDINEMLPSEFIPIAEQSNLILPLSQWVLKEAFAQQKKWHQLGYTHHFLSINISSKHFFHDDLHKALLKFGEEKKELIKTIHLELTEAILMSDSSKCEQSLSRLKEAGFSLSIDDFGTGSSSLLRIKTLAIDTIKIDHSFIQNMDNDETNRVIVESILNLANSLNLNVIAEGIESKEDYKFLVEQDCDQGQGFYFSKPLPASQITERFKREGTS